MNESLDYEPKLISFIDILGWTRAINNKKFHELFEAINGIQKRCNSYSAQHRKELERIDEFKINPMFFQVKFSMFSDSIAISMPENFGARICNTSSELIREFILQGFLLRGGITKGSLYHDNQTIFGKAIVDAHNLESRHAKLSRILIERNVVNELKESDATSIIKDHLGEYVVDPFPIMASGLTDDILCQIYKLDKLMDVLQENLKIAEDLNALQKWEYMVILMHKSLSKFGNTTNAALKKLDKLIRDI